MDLTVFTWPNALKGEIALIRALIKKGLQTVHLRKPNWSASETARFLASLSYEELNTIILHQHPELRHDYPIKGIHFSTRLQIEGNERILNEDQWLFSTSVHEIDQISTLPFNFSMAYISPIFDSISKSNHFANFECYILHEFLNNHNTMPLVYALGGVSAENIPIAKHLGFNGVGVLGALWEQYRTQGFKPAVNHFSSLVQACKA